MKQFSTIDEGISALLALARTNENLWVGISKNTVMIHLTERISKDEVKSLYYEMVVTYMEGTVERLETAYNEVSKIINDK